MWDGINRRKFPRIHYKCMIYIKKADTTKRISTYTENVGAGGICVVLNEDLGLFQGVNLEIALENGVGTSVACSGTIVWVVKKHLVSKKNALQYDTGIEFVDMDKEGESRISKIIEKELKKVPSRG
jgi:hypothetical protein